VIFWHQVHCIYTYTYTYTCKSVCMCVYIYSIHMHMHRHMHIYMPMHMHAYIYTHTQTHTFPLNKCYNTKLNHHLSNSGFLLPIVTFLFHVFVLVHWFVIFSSFMLSVVTFNVHHSGLQSTHTQANPALGLTLSPNPNFNPCPNLNPNRPILSLTIELSWKQLGLGTSWLPPIILSLTLYSHKPFTLYSPVTLPVQLTSQIFSFSHDSSTLFRMVD